MHELSFEAVNDRLPPQNVEAEESILGGVLLDPEAIGRVADILQPEVFYLAAHQEIYRSALALHAQGSPTDLMCVLAWLQDQGTLAKVGGQNKLTQLVDRTVSAVNIDQYANLIKEKYLRRQLIKAANEISQRAYETTLPLDAVLDQAEQRIFSVTQDRIQQGLVPTEEILARTFADLEQRSLGNVLPGLSCNFYDLDAMTQGFQRSDLIIVAGRPAMGKCLAADAEILLADGRIATIAELYHQRQAALLTLQPNWTFTVTAASDFIDDGIKPVWRVTTRLGRTVTATAPHPFLTPQGWQPLRDLLVGTKIAVPRQLPVFGQERLKDCQVKLLGYLLGDGCLTKTSPSFTNGNPRLQSDFQTCIQEFGNLLIRHEDSQGCRTKSLVVTADPQYLQQQRQVFAHNLAQVLQQQSLDSVTIAQSLGVNESLVRHWLSATCVPHPETFTALCQYLQVAPADLAPYGFSKISKFGQNQLTLWLKQLDLWGCNAHTKFIPADVFSLQRSQIALLLNRLFATDGWACLLASGQAQLGLATVSEKLARQVQHLLLRFGIIARLKSRQVKYQQERRPAWQLDITDAAAIQTFASEIGIFGKEAALNRVVDALSAKTPHSNTDLISISVWQQLAVAKGSQSWAAVAELAGIVGSSNLHVGKRALKRDRLYRLAAALEDLPLQQLAESEVYWDEIVAIEAQGEQQVYDLTIPETHNFVANDICVHNTALSLQIAKRIAEIHKMGVAVYSLEMSKEQLVQRLLASESRIDSNYLRAGRINQNQWEPLSRAIGTLSQLPLYIDDTPNPSLGEIRSNARRLQSERGGLGLILIDYLQLMGGGDAQDGRVQELSKITRALKGLARELHVPVVALSQLSRGVESRTNKRPLMSDLRESGSIEQDADLIILLYRDEYYNPDTPDRGICELILAKHRNGPVGTVKLLFDPQFTRFENLAQSR
jgi:replicative DNA helicase